MFLAERKTKSEIFYIYQNNTLKKPPIGWLSEGDEQPFSSIG